MLHELVSFKSTDREIERERERDIQRQQDEETARNRDEENFLSLMAIHNGHLHT